MKRKKHDLVDLPDQFRNILGYTRNQIRHFGDAVFLPDFAFDMVQLMHMVDFGDEAKNSIAKDFRKLLDESIKDSKDYFSEKLDLIQNKREEYMQSLYAQGFVYLWAVLESYIKQLLATLIDFDKEILEKQAFSSVKMPMSEFFELDDDERPLFLANLIITSLSSGKGAKYGIDKFESYLKAFELDGPLNDKDKQNILMLHHFRNCIVHNDSVVDARLSKNCGWLQYKTGDRLIIKEENFRGCEDSVLVYIHEIYYRVHKLLGAPDSTLKALREILDGIINRHNKEGEK